MYDDEPGNRRRLAELRRQPEYDRPFVEEEPLVDAHERALADLAEARDHDMRRDEAVVMDNYSMTDVVAAPDDHVVADPHVMLQDVVLEDERVLADRDVVPNEGTRTDVGGADEAGLLDAVEETSPHPIELGRRDRDEGIHVARVVVTPKLLEGDHRQSFLRVLVEVPRLDGKPTTSSGESCVKYSYAISAFSPAPTITRWSRSPTGRA